jgi:hypothetical protein
MLRWSEQQQANARNIRTGIIFRIADPGEPPFLGIAEIEENRSNPNFKSPIRRRRDKLPALAVRRETDAILVRVAPAHC